MKGGSKISKTELIKEFIKVANSHYPNLDIWFDYNEDLDEYMIWHDDLHLEFQDNNFKKTVGKIAHDILFNNDVYNFSFGCDYRGFDKNTKEGNIS